MLVHINGSLVCSFFVIETPIIIKDCLHGVTLTSLCSNKHYFDMIITVYTIFNLDHIFFFKCLLGYILVLWKIKSYELFLLKLQI